MNTEDAIKHLESLDYKVEAPKSEVEILKEKVKNLENEILYLKMKGGLSIYPRSQKFWYDRHDNYLPPFTVACSTH